MVFRKEIIYHNNSINRALGSVLKFSLFYLPPQAYAPPLFLGRHFGCRPLDPTLDIWSNLYLTLQKTDFRSLPFHIRTQF